MANKTSFDAQKRTVGLEVSREASDRAVRAIAVNPDAQFGAAFEMQVTLREGDLDALSMEPVPHVEQDLAFHVDDAVRWVGNPDPKFQIDRAFAEAHEAAHRLR